MEFHIGNTYKAVFESNYGYNTSTRIGRIYEFSCRGIATYMCIVNPDLRDISSHLRHFIRIARNRTRLNIAVRHITPHDIRDRELGLVNTEWLTHRNI